MEDIIEGIIRLQEDFMLALLATFQFSPAIGVDEIPAAERDPSCPIRFRMTLAIGALPTT